MPTVRRTLRTKTRKKKQKFVTLSLRSTLAAGVATVMLFWVNGTASANQFSAITTVANTIVSAILSPTSLFTTTTSQTSSGPVNQDVLYDGSADTVSDVSGAIAADNTADIVQAETAVGSTNQDGTIDAGALSDVF